MNDAPDRIAINWQPGAAVTSGPLMEHEDYTRFVREDALREAANRNALTVRSIKEAIELRDYDAAREIAMKGNAALVALIDAPLPKRDT